jgi:glycosyltransferase involved in cell wall biosynthesis
MSCATRDVPSRGTLRIDGTPLEVETASGGQAQNHQLLVSRDLGGAGLIALHLARFLTGRSWKSRVWVPGDGPALCEARKLGLPTQEFDLGKASSSHLTTAAVGNWKIARALRRAGRGIVHVHGPGCYGALRWGLRLSSLKRVVHVHIEHDETELRWAFKQPPDLIITCARFLEPQVRRALPPRSQERQRIEPVPNAVDTDRFFPGDKQAAKNRLGAPAKAPLVLMLANLAPHKGQETAIRAVASLKRRGIDVVCWLAGVERGGETGFTARLRSLIGELEVSDRVQLLGYRSDAADLLRAADFFLLPSKREGLPLSIVEAQATRVPVLAAPTAGIPEVVKHGETGFLLPAEDADGYAACMTRLLANPALVESIVTRAYIQVVRDYQFRALCQRISELYGQLFQ